MPGILDMMEDSVTTRRVDAFRLFAPAELTEGSLAMDLGSKEGVGLKVVDFTLFGQRFQAISAGPLDPFNHAISMVVVCDDQKELDRYWDALLQGGKPEACGWLRDKYGLSWQIVPAVMDELMADRDPVRSKRVTDAMLKMIKLDIAKLQAAYDGKSQASSRLNSRGWLRVLAVGSEAIPLPYRTNTGANTATEYDVERPQRCVPAHDHPRLAAAVPMGVNPFRISRARHTPRELQRVRGIAEDVGDGPGGQRMFQRVVVLPFIIGTAATDIKVSDDPNLIVNMSVWEPDGQRTYSMSSAFRYTATVTGEWTHYDIVALQYLY